MCNLYFRLKLTLPGIEFTDAVLQITLSQILLTVSELQTTLSELQLLEKV